MGGNSIGLLIRRGVKYLLIAVCILLAAVIGYLAYVLLSYSRIPDNLTVQPVTGSGVRAAGTVGMDEELTAVTYNIGFGAYTPEFTFFMDGGTQSWAESPESVKTCIGGAGETVISFDPDFVFFQEVDTDSTRSYHIDEERILSEEYFPAYCSVSASCYHSAFLMYPLYQPHGASNCSLVTYSRFSVSDAVRRSLPVSESLSKLLDYDRAYTVSRVPTADGHELVMYNVHFSAYGNSDEVRSGQMGMLFEDMSAEYAKGNYCICAADFNHDLTGNSNEVINGGKIECWAADFPAGSIPDGFSRCIDYTDGILPTCRSCEKPYEPGDFGIIVDGFIVSDNIETLSIQNIQTGFAYSDHNPVVLHFKLKPEA